MTNYPLGNGVGMDNVVEDRFSVENLGNGTCRFHFELNGNDNIRLLALTATPEPATWAGFALTGLALAGIGRRRKKARA